MSRNLVLPFFPVAPTQYDQQYLAEVVRSFAVYLEQMQNPGEGRNTFSVFTNLQTDDSGLEADRHASDFHSVGMCWQQYSIHFSEEE